MACLGNYAGTYEAIIAGEWGTRESRQHPLKPARARGKGARRLILTRNRTTLLVECSHCTFGNGKPKRTLGAEAHIAASSSTHGRKIRKVGV
jgi:hypothetical protein